MRGILYRIARPIFFGGVPEWPKGADCKSAGSAFGGSNPPPSTIISSTEFKSGTSICKYAGGGFEPKEVRKNRQERFLSTKPSIARKR